MSAPTLDVRDVWVIVLGMCSSGRPGSYGRLFRVCKRFKGILEDLERQYWLQSLQLDGISFKWVGLVNAAAFYHKLRGEMRHLNPQAPISPFAARNPSKPTAFFRLVVIEALEEARDRKRPQLRFFRGTRAVLCKRGLHQDKALVSATWQDSKLIYSAIAIGNGVILTSGAYLPITLGSLGLDLPLSGPLLDRRRLDLTGTYIAPSAVKLDISYLIIDPILKRLNSWTDKHWYSTNPSRRYYPEDQRARELGLLGIDDTSYLAEEAWLFTRDWPNGSYKLLLAVLMPGQKITIIIHRHG